MLLDLQMPKKNGLQVVMSVRELYKEREYKGVPLKEPIFVFLTAYYTLGFKDYIQTKGITQIYEKPLMDV